MDITTRRCATNAVSARRNSGRVNGSRSSSPATSVTKPGVSISVPPIRISAPSAISAAGIRPLCSAVRNARQARPPSCRTTQAPAMLSATSSSTVHPPPITWPTWIST